MATFVHACSSCQPEAAIVCSDTQALCDGQCVATTSDRRHCGGCNQACGDREGCVAGVCTACTETETLCFNRCVSLTDDELNCGQCGARCDNGTCVSGACQCAVPTTFCSGGCFELATSKAHCGGCGVRCLGAEVCAAGTCELSCPAGFTACSGVCIDTSTNRLHCGRCDAPCSRTQGCDAGTCATPADPDGDGFTVLTGDCCETTTTCPRPAQVNPAAPDVPNGIDDNCDGLVDAVRPDGGCDDGLLPGSALDAGDYARAMDVCEGLLWADVRRADGTQAPLSAAGIGILESVGPERAETGNTMLVLGSGRANQPAGLGPASLGSNVELNQCQGPGCLQDWFGASNGSLKVPGLLPSTPQCQAGSSDSKARDSIMLHLKLKAPQQARSFSLLTRFYSQEFPEYVCSPYNDQVVVLTTSTAQNPPDHNLMTFTKGGLSWPIGINVASGTPLFQACETERANPKCWDQSLSPDSCTEGPAVLAGTYFDKTAPTTCLRGGATARLITRGNVKGGEEFELRIAIWDVGDHILDSFITVDSFRWHTTSETPGTTGQRRDGGTID